MKTEAEIKAEIEYYKDYIYGEYDTATAWYTGYIRALKWVLEESK